MSKPLHLEVGQHADLTQHSVEELLVILWALLNNHGVHVRMFLEEIDVESLGPDGAEIVDGIAAKFQDLLTIDEAFWRIAKVIIEKSCGCNSEHEFNADYVRAKYGKKRKSRAKRSIEA
jgi:hypothetical protein